MKIRRIIEIDEKIVETLKTDCLEFGEIHEVEVAIANGIPYEERKQGEWIKEPNGRTTDLYRCSVCKRSIMLCKGADLTNYPFCHCGADMRGGTDKGDN